jgi:hypothetical protein
MRAGFSIGATGSKRAFRVVLLFRRINFSVAEFIAKAPGFGQQFEVSEGDGGLYRSIPLFGAEDFAGKKF